ncbi:hypothetical protein NDU88_005890 [Pleurodeles waltl]|uniref:Uncharacterized protein n=1 Tax=Pleurodeles waltl TaxID=8319 RepID=A0AAV7TBR2_PLEWA|nr:hypothetical protein NDU88_005890 [Pleurodeles waltl]
MLLKRGHGDRPSTKVLNKGRTADPSSCELQHSKLHVESLLPASAMSYAMQTAVLHWRRGRNVTVAFQLDQHLVRKPSNYRSATALLRSKWAYHRALLSWPVAL